MKHSWKILMLTVMLTAAHSVSLTGCGGGGGGSGSTTDNNSGFDITGKITFAGGLPSSSTTVKLYKTSYTIYSTATASGKLYSTRDGSGSESISLEQVAKETVSDTNGLYDLSGVPSGSYTIVPTRTGYLFKSVAIPTLDRIGVLTISDSGTVYLYNPEGSGNQLTDDGKTIYNSTPQILTGKILTDQDFLASLPGGSGN